MNRTWLVLVAFIAVMLHSGFTWAVNCTAGLSASNPDTMYVDHGDGTVTDTRTGLMWKKCSEGQAWSSNTCSSATDRTLHTWSAALELAANSTFAGYDNWRLPNRKELASLVEECRSYPAINDTLFPNTSSSYVWSASSYAVNSSQSWYMVGHNGAAYGDGSRSSAYAVRLVRGGSETIPSIPSSYSLIVAIGGNGTVISSPPGIDCGSDCS
jgi:hypothetical protein